MTVIRPYCGEWKVLLPWADGKHADTLFQGTKDECEKYKTWYDENAAEECDCLFGRDDVDEINNAFADWLTDGKQGGALELLAKYNKAVTA